MQINQTKDDDVLTIALLGRLDTNTAPQLQSALEDKISGTKKVVIDLCELEYISSAGLRVLLFLHKQCVREDAQLCILNCNEVTMDVFKMTGFDKVLNIS